MKDSECEQFPLMYQDGNDGHCYADSMAKLFREVWTRRRALFSYCG